MDKSLFCGLEVARRVVGYATGAISALDHFRTDDGAELCRARVLMEKLERALMIFGRVIDQTERRVIRGEKVCAAEKDVSITNFIPIRSLPNSSPINFIGFTTT